MTCLLMLHEASQRPAVWRFVSDNLSPSWGVVAPQLHGCSSIEDMQSAITRDMNATLIEPPIFIVTTGEAAIPAIEWALHGSFSHAIGGIFLSGPQLAVTKGAVRAARIGTLTSGVSSRKKRGKRAGITDSFPEERYAYLQALREYDSGEALAALAESNMPVRIVAGTKDRSGSAGACELAALLHQSEFFPIEQAEADWNAYAPAIFAANVAEFIFKETETAAENATEIAPEKTVTETETKKE